MTETSLIANIDFFIRYACIGQLLMFTHTMPVFLWLFGKQLFDDAFEISA